MPLPGRILPYLVQRPLARVMLNAQNNMVAKNNSKETRGTKWREVELKVFVTVLTDDRNEFALTLETLALKKSANFHIFQNIKKELNARLQTENIECSKKGKEKAIETSVVKLRAKYKWLKEQWRKFTDRTKSGSGKSAIDEPEWFTIIDPIFSETHTELKVATKAADILNRDDSSEDDEYNEKEDTIEEIKLATSMVPRERKQPLDSSTSSLEASSEQSHLSGNESEEECNR